MPWWPSLPEQGLAHMLRAPGKHIILMHAVVPLGGPPLGRCHSSTAPRMASQVPVQRTQGWTQQNQERHARGTTLQLAPLQQLPHTPVMLVHSQGGLVHSHGDAIQSFILALELCLSVQCQSLQLAQDLCQLLGFPLRE